MVNDELEKAQAKLGGTLTTNEDVHPLLRIIIDSEFYDEEVDGRDMALRLLDYDTVEELLAAGEELEAQELTHAGDMLDKPFMLHSVKFNQGDKNPDWPLYAVMEVTWNGEKDMMSCGGMNVCVAAFQMARKGWLPRMVKITEREKATRAGFHPLNLVAAGDPGVSVDGDGTAF